MSLRSESAHSMDGIDDGAQSAAAGGGRVPPMALSHPDLRRTLKDMLVADEVSDSDFEMIEQASVYDDRMEGSDNADAADPEMCVECGDQVESRHPLSRVQSHFCASLFFISSLRINRVSRELRCGATNAKNNTAKSVSTISSIAPENANYIPSKSSILTNPSTNPPPKQTSPRQQQQQQQQEQRQQKTELMRPPKKDSTTMMNP
jgi:hypothetical protein